MKNQNEMKLHDESWLNYQKGKGEESFQAYLADLTDMQEHVLPYLQPFNQAVASIIFNGSCYYIGISAFYFGIPAETVIVEHDVV